MSPPCYTHKNFSPNPIFLCAEESQRQTRDHIQPIGLRMPYHLNVKLPLKGSCVGDLVPTAAVFRDGHLRNDCIIKAVTLSKGQFTDRHHWWWHYCEVVGWGGGSWLEGRDGTCLRRLSPACGAPSLSFPLWFLVSTRGSAPPIVRSLCCSIDLKQQRQPTTAEASEMVGRVNLPFNLSSPLRHSKGKLTNM